MESAAKGGGGAAGAEEGVAPGAGDGAAVGGGAPRTIRVGDEDQEVLAEFEIGGDELESLSSGEELAEEEEGEEGEEGLEAVGEEGEGEDEEDEEDSEPAGPDTSVQQYTAHTGPIYAIDVSPDGARVATASGDDTCHLWAAADGRTQAVLKGHGDSVVAARFNAAGTLLATGAMDGSVKIWDPSSGKSLHTLEGPSGDITWASWHPKGDVLLAGSADATVWMWSVAPSKAACMQVFAGHEDAVTAGMFSPSGKAVVTGSADGSVRVWNPKSGACSQVFSGHGWCEGPVNAVACHHERPLLVAASQDGTARLANTATGKVIAALAHQEGDVGEDATTSVEAAAFCTTHPWLATGATDRSLIVWDVGTGAARSRVPMAGGVVKIEFVPDSPTLVVATSRGVVSLVDCRTGEEAARLTGHRGIVLDFRLVGSRIFTAGDDGVARQYSLEGLLPR